MSFRLWSCSAPFPSWLSVPPSPLTTLIGDAVLGCALVQGLLLTVVVLVCFSVSARAGADAAFERPAAQNLPTVGAEWDRSVLSRVPTSPHPELLDLPSPQAPHRSRAPYPSPPSYSRVSRVMMMRMGLRFMPPTQLLLHMKL